MSGKLYSYDMSCTCMSVYFAEAALGLNLEHIEVNVWKQKQFSSEFVAINPQHSVPTFVDNDGTIVWDSHAINIYLVSKYGKDESLYPQQHAKRALIHQRLFFDTTIFIRFQKIFVYLVFKHQQVIDDDIQQVMQSYEMLETFLSKSKWVADDVLTVADFSLISTITTCTILFPIDSQKFPNIRRWIKKC